MAEEGNKKLDKVLPARPFPCTTPFLYYSFPAAFQTPRIFFKIYQTELSPPHYPLSCAFTVLVD